MGTLDVDNIECPYCKFVVAPGEAAIDGTCPNCQRPYRSQPSPLKSDMEMRNMPAPGEEDMGGNPLQEGILGDYQNRGVRDESYASVKTSSCPHCWEDQEYGQGGSWCNTPGCPGNWYGGKDVLKDEDPEFTRELIDAIKKRRELAEEPEFEVTDVLPPDPDSLREGNRQMKRIAFLPLLLEAGGALLGRAAAGSLLEGALGTGAADGALGQAARAVGGTLGQRSMEPQQQQQQLPNAPAGPPQAPMGLTVPQFSSVQVHEQLHHGMLQAIGAEEELKSPSSIDHVMDEEHDYDTKQKDVGEKDKDLQVGQGVNDQGGTDQGAFDPKGEGAQLFEQLLPKILHYLTTDESGQNDQDLLNLHDVLDQEQPGFMKDADPEQGAHLLMMIVKGKPGEGESDDHLEDNDAPHDPLKESNVSPEMQSTCFMCGGTIDPSTGACTHCGLGNPRSNPQPVNTNQSPFTARVADVGIGPQTREQQAAVAEVLEQMGKPELIKDMIEDPTADPFPDILAQIQQQDQPPQPPEDPAPPPPEAEMPPGGGMPVPGMSTPGGGGMGMPGMMSAIYRYAATVDGLAEKCPKCDSHSTGYLSEEGHCGCKACGHKWKSKEIGEDPSAKTGAKTAEDRHVQEHGDNFDNSVGVAGADEVHQRNVEKEQDTSQTWMDDDGNPLKVGSEYEMYSDKYDIPDIIRIEAVKPDSIEYSLTGEYGLDHRTEVSYEEANIENLHFVPAHGDEELTPEDPGLEENMEDIGRPTPGTNQTDLSTPHMRMTHQKEGEALNDGFLDPYEYPDPTICPGCRGNGEVDGLICPDCEGSGTNPVHTEPEFLAKPDTSFNGIGASTEDTGPDWLMDGVRTAGQHYTPLEQRQLIDEDGAARNADLLNLSGTHYEDVPDDQFLFGGL